MTPAARIQAAIDILDRWMAGSDGMDRVLAAWGRQNRYAGSGDRRAIGDLVHQALRRKRSAAWLAGRDDEANGRCLLHGLLRLEGQDPEAFFTGERHAPAPLTSAELAARRSLSGAPRAVGLDYPGWMEADLAGIDDAELALLLDRAPLDLRVNLLKADREVAVAALAEDGIAVRPCPLSPTALRVLEGHRKVQASKAWQSGLIEIQDAASQAIADLARARPGEAVLDLCAGGGGKTLALAAATGNRARLLAHDIDPNRMKDLPARAQRAGARVEVVQTHRLEDLNGRLDLVVVDAPCSGSGTWRRNPDAKWRLSAAELDELCACQGRLMDQAAALCADRGRILYATCSIVDRENRAQVCGWLARHPRWSLVAEKCLPPSAGGDGMYGAVLS